MGGGGGASYLQNRVAPGYPSTLFVFKRKCVVLNYPNGKGSRLSRCQAKLFRAHSIIQPESPCGKSMKMQNVIGVAVKTRLCSLSLSKLLAVPR